MSVRIDCTALKLMPTSLAMLRRSRLLSHITRVCTTLTFLSAVASLGWPILHPQHSLSPRLKLCWPFIHCAIRRRLLPKGFKESFMNFLGRHAFLAQELDNRSDFKLFHFANMSHPPLLKVLTEATKHDRMLFTLLISFN